MMRNEALTGYLLHHRPYQEKRALYYLFSYEQGVIHGVGKKGAPLFEPLQLFATGKNDLKTFSQIALLPSIENGSERYQQITGQRQYAALYINEILWRLLPTGDAMPSLWQHYQDSLSELKQPLTADDLRLCLRRFEQHLFVELGFAIALTTDHAQTAIDATCYYRFLPDMGLVTVERHEQLTPLATQNVFSGQDLILMIDEGISLDTVALWSRLHRQWIDYLLDYQPLQSRLLWQQQQRYQ